MMSKEELIKKWLDNNLNNEELKAFEALDDYNELIKISKYTKGFKAPEFNSEEVYNSILQTTQEQQTNNTPNWLYKAISIAAMFLISFGVYLYTKNSTTSYNTNFAEKKEIVLPDNSIVKLNAKSTLTLNTDHWDEKRHVTLDGEAFFKVEKGSSFNVITSSGTVTVLGTQFNVKQRDNYFEVVCYEGSVNVNYKNEHTILKLGDSFLVTDTLVSNPKISNTQPLWLNNISQFKSIAFKNVIAEFERQYNVTVITKQINTNELFTGKFTHKNIDIALQSITQPLQITYTKTNKTITLSRE